VNTPQRFENGTATDRGGTAGPTWPKENGSLASGGTDLKVFAMEKTSTLPATQLLYILHRGLTEIRNLALASGQEQIADLADALEILPGMIENWNNDQSEMAHFVLQAYQSKYPSRAYDYVGQLERQDVPEQY
jgi:hypothetical protein